jgi:hypothetical protein
VLVAIISIAGASWFYKKRYDNGLLMGAGTAATILFQIQSDDTVSHALIIAVGLAYAAFHVTYCKRIITSFSYGEGYMAVTIIIAATTGVSLLQVPALATAWNKSSGVSNVGFFTLIHIITVFLSSVLVKCARQVSLTAAEEDIENDLPLYHANNRSSEMNSGDIERMGRRRQYAASSRSRAGRGGQEE